MKEETITPFVLEALLKSGFEKAQCVLTMSEKHELNIASGSISLLRTVYDAKVDLMGITDKKRGSISVNKTDEATLKAAADEAFSLADASVPDDANDIAPKEPALQWEKGSDLCDVEMMYDRLNAFVAYVQKQYPFTCVDNSVFDFTLTRRFYRNSSGSYLSSRIGRYNFFLCCMSKENGRTSSFDFTAFGSSDLEREIWQTGDVDATLKASSQSLITNRYPSKISGDVIFMPRSFGEVLHFLHGSISDLYMIDGTSVYKDCVDQMIASPLLTVQSLPTDTTLAGGYAFTSDGYIAENCKYVENGVLRSFLLGLFASKKTARPVSRNRGESIAVAPGESSLDDMIGSVENGILLGRFSGGCSVNGDFSGVAKNSFMIENGKIKGPLSETMISGNYAAALRDIKNISKERTHFGDAVIPWVQIGNITISGA